MKIFFYIGLTFLLSVQSLAQNQFCEQPLKKDTTSPTEQQLQFFKNPPKEVLDQLLSLISSISKVDLGTLVRNKKIKADEIYDLGEKATTPQEQSLLLQLSRLVENNQLTGFITQTLQLLDQKADQIPQLMQIRKMTPQQKDYIVGALTNIITATVQLRGLIKIKDQIQYREWQELSELITNKINQVPKGFSELLHFSNSKWTRAQEVEVLVDGEASFAKRDLLMKFAQSSIDILSWSFYDDLTGNEAADLLIQKKNQGIKVRVVIDGQIASTSGHQEVIKKLEANGIEVIRWMSTKNPYQGQHRKMIIVDDEHVIAGGLNFGDVYSHKNPDTNIARWRDTDIYVRGKVAITAISLFSKIWNEQIDSGIVKFAKMENISANEMTDPLSKEDGYRVAIIDHNPTEANSSGSTIMLTLLKGIREAKKSIEIENAYIILFPALKNEIKQAIQRGVKVSVFTNSAQSVDEPIISIPILRSAQQLSEMGANVTLKKGATLHSKLVIIDGQYTMIMSYNLHPRSERVEGEMAVLVDNTNFAQKMQQVFQSDTNSTNAISILKASDIELPNSLSVLAVLRIFFDMI